MIKQILTVVITTIITLYLTYYFASSTLEYEEGFKEQYFNKSNKLFDGLDIRFNGRKIDNISIYEFTIYNNSYEDLENVKIYFTLKPKEGKIIPNIINRGLFPPSNLPNNKIIELVQEENVFVYEIPLLKQTNFNEYYLARFIFEGKEVPQISITTPETKNVDIIEYRYFKIYALMIGILFTVMVMLIFIFEFIDKWSNNKFWKTKRIPKLKQLLKKLKEKELNLNDSEIDLIVSEYEKSFKPNEDNYLYKKMLGLFKTPNLLK